MTKLLGPFFVVIAFVTGLSVGLYTGAEFKIEEKLAIENLVANSVQDSVIRRVQAEESLGEEREKDMQKQEDDNVIEVTLNEEKISPYANLVIKKNFTKCGHSTLNTVEIPKEIINFTENELREKYTGWEIEAFSTTEIVLSRNIEANCDDHYVIKEKDGKIAVYNELTDDKMNLVQIVDVNTELLGEEDKETLSTGIRVYGKEELSSAIEDYDS